MSSKAKTGTSVVGLVSMGDAENLDAEVTVEVPADTEAIPEGENKHKHRPNMRYADSWRHANGMDKDLISGFMLNEYNLSDESSGTRLRRQFDSIDRRSSAARVVLLAPERRTQLRSSSNTTPTRTKTHSGQSLYPAADYGKNLLAYLLPLYDKLSFFAECLKALTQAGQSPFWMVSANRNQGRNLHSKCHERGMPVMERDSTD
ncbi:hypothetical protein DFH08DRAFT_945636 [Mycena albidolilacea]|uniref:Uncharacterized protein n=1 Tax=Mycena albidolilacea TaxID=1033008 RepID=A0AAD7E8Q5_9AGAR|nr:hypothetical protein DFH08DRAFT_945636 [Mycena albidolilacea]